jgi:hypothetical protein
MDLTFGIESARSYKIRKMRNYLSASLILFSSHGQGCKDNDSKSSAFPISRLIEFSVLVDEPMPMVGSS